MAKTPLDEVLSQVGGSVPGGSDPFAPGAALDEMYELDLEEEAEKIPRGIYHAVVISFEKTASSKGNPQYELDIKLLEQGATKKYWMSLLPQARWKVTEDLEKLGLKGEGGSILRFKKSDVVGKPCRVEVIWDDYTGSMRDKINKILAPDDKTLRLAAVGI